MRLLDRARASAVTTQPVFDYDENLGWLLIEACRPMGSEWADIDTERRHQPREYFDEEKLASLGESIDREGQLKAITVYPVAPKRVDHEVEYEILDGERRWRAMKAGGHTRIKVVILNADQRQAFRLAVIADAHDEKWSAAERGKALSTLKRDMEAELQEWLDKSVPEARRGNMRAADYARMVEEVRDMPAWVLEILERTKGTGQDNRQPKVTWDDVALVCGLTKAMIHDLVSISELPGDVVADIERGEISGRQARAITRLDDPRQQRRLATEIKTKRLSGQAALQRAAEMMGRKRTPLQPSIAAAAKPDPLEESLRPAVSLAARAAKEFAQVSLTPAYRKQVRREVALLREHVERLEDVVG